MSVAEALNAQVRTSGAGSHRSKYYAGLKLDNLRMYTDDDPAPPGIERDNILYTSGPASPKVPSDPVWGKQQNFDELREQNQNGRDDLYRMRESQRRETIEGGEEKVKNYEDPWTVFRKDQMGQGHGGARKPETDLFLDTLGGPSGTVLRQNGHPPLSDPRFQQQQQQFQQRQPSSGSFGMTPTDIAEYRHNLDQTSNNKRAARQQQRRLDDLEDRYNIKHNKRYQGADKLHSYTSTEMRAASKISEGRSLDLENSKGGAGAPIKDPWGKHVTRMPITLSRDDYGELAVRAQSSGNKSTITEDIPGKATFDLDFTNEDSKPYYPWGGQGGGAPIRNRDGSVVTQIFGKLEERNGMDGEVRRNKRRQEVLYNELKECARQQQENRDELTRYMRAPQAELAELLLAGRVGKPKRDEITGEVISQQHLSNSDVSKWKMNYQPVPTSEKKLYYDELVKMAEERQLQKQLEKLKERQESNAHFQYMDATWGAFGGGAPKHHVIRKKVNLTNSLFYPQEPQETQHEENDYMPPSGLGSFEYQQPSNMGYQKQFPDSDSRHGQSPFGSPRHFKSNTRSSHKNQYDTSGDHGLAGSSRQYLPPYATEGM